MNSVVVILACVLVAVSAQQYNRYQPYNQYNQYNRYQNQYQNQFQSQYQNKYSPYKSPYVTRAPFQYPTVAPTTAKPAVVPIAPVATVVVPAPVPVPAVLSNVVAKFATDAAAETVKYGDEFVNDGRNYYFETNNGIAVQAQIIPRNYGGNPPVISDVAQGSFSWISPEGKTIAVTYTADENGYQPSSDALPQAPEVPAQIARALAYGARFSAGINN